jgi:hypothetical protein
MLARPVLQISRRKAIPTTSTLPFWLGAGNGAAGLLVVLLRSEGAYLSPAYAAVTCRICGSQNAQA